MRIFITAKFEVDSIEKERSVLSELVTLGINEGASLYDLNIAGDEADPDKED